eukprot:jgi/Botrbrau1/12750/Bobra.67_1s0109.1
MSRRLDPAHRPPTPDPEEDPSNIELTLEDEIRLKLRRSGELERLKLVLKERLEDCGWRDDVYAQAREFVKKQGREQVTVDDIVRHIKPFGRAAVPDTVKAELLKRLQKEILS